MSCARRLKDDFVLSGTLVIISDIMFKVLIEKQIRLFFRSQGVTIEKPGMYTRIQDV